MTDGVYSGGIDLWWIESAFFPRTSRIYSAYRTPYPLIPSIIAIESQRLGLVMVAYSGNCRTPHSSNVTMVLKYFSSEVSSSGARPELNNSGWMDVPSGKFTNSPFASVLMARRTTWRSGLSMTFWTFCAKSIKRPRWSMMGRFRFLAEK